MTTTREMLEDAARERVGLRITNGRANWAPTRSLADALAMLAERKLNISFRVAVGAALPVVVYSCVIGSAPAAAAIGKRMKEGKE